MNNQNKTNENQASLISRLMAKFHNPKIVKTLAGLILCGTIALSAVSCSNQGNKDPNDTSTNLPGTGLEDQYDENKKDESSNDETSQYSQMLLNVLNNDHYNSLIAQAKNNPEIYERGEFKPHPYGFLEDEGYDVNAIMNGEIGCYTMSYVMKHEPNNLYMYTRVNNGSYYSNYLLKYELTNQEMKDYDFTHDHLSEDRHFYIQAVFLNNEISQIKTPTIVGESHMTLQAFEGMTSTMQNRDYVTTHKCDIIMTNPVDEIHRFELKVIPAYASESKMTYSDNIVDMYCGADIYIEDNIYKAPFTYGVFDILEEESYKTKFYFPQKTNLKAFMYKDLSK